MASQWGTAMQTKINRCKGGLKTAVRRTRSRPIPAAASALFGLALILLGQPALSQPAQPNLRLQFDQRVPLQPELERRPPKSNDPILMPVREHEYPEQPAAIPVRPGYSSDPDVSRPRLPQDRCDVAAHAMLAQLFKYNFGDSAQSDYAAIAASDPDYVRAAAAYDSACFKRIADMPPALDAANLRQLVGFFALGDKGFCSGFRIGPTRVMTAMHCFYDKQSKTPYFNAENLQRVRFALASQPASDYAIAALQLNARFEDGVFDSEPIAHADDYIFVDLNDAGTLPLLPEFTLAEPKVGDRLFVLGLTSYTQHRTWPEGIRLVDRQICKIAIASRDRCIFHGCQTTPGFSGTPLIRLSADNRLEVVGLQIAAARDTGNCGAADRVRLQGNVGTALPQTVIDQIARR
jgi:V8-like Glu-specific endopeptidase